MCAVAPLAPAIHAASATGISLLEAINQAGRQRMLSQRMAKLYTQILREIRIEESRKLLADSMALFERQLGNLRTVAKQNNATEIIATYDTLGVRWQDYKAIVGATPGMEGLKQVVSLNEQVLATAHQGTVQLEKLHGGSLGKLVNIAGRQRMLSQRISKFYFFQRAGVATPEMLKAMETARTEFINALGTLRGAQENSNDSLSWLGLADSQWLFFDDAVHADQNDKRSLAYHDNNLAITSENLLQVMDKLTNLYAANPA